MSRIAERLGRRAREGRRRVVLAEGEDRRVVVAAARLAERGLAEVELIAEPEVARAVAAAAGVTLEGVSVRDPREEEERGRADRALEESRGARLDPQQRRRLAADPLFQAATRVRLGLADGLVAGAARPTAEVVRSALWLIGMSPGISAVSSFFLMVIPPRADRPEERVLSFADGGVLPEPSAAQLAEIACLTADNHQRLTGEIPRAAFLSFSTLGSARHPRVDKVREALGMARSLRPDLLFEGEIQADAALDPEVGRIKAPGSEVAGRANVLVFPDLDAGNIGYKLVQRLAGADAYGPLLQGLARQAHDLSRGCSADDVVQVATIAAVLSAESQAPSPGGRAARDLH